MSESTSPRGKVTVFVSREDNARILTFHRPADIPIAELLEHGLAVDGPAAVISIAINPEVEGHPYMADDLGPYSTLSSALVAVERWLASFLGDRGYEVAFA